MCIKIIRFTEKKNTIKQKPNSSHMFSSYSPSSSRLRFSLFLSHTNNTYLISSLISFALLLINNNKYRNSKFRNEIWKKRLNELTIKIWVCAHAFMYVCVCNFYLRMAPNSWKRIEKSRLYELYSVWVFGSNFRSRIDFYVKKFIVYTE